MKKSITNSGIGYFLILCMLAKASLAWGTPNNYYYNAEDPVISSLSTDDPFRFATTETNTFNASSLVPSSKLCTTPIILVPPVNSSVCLASAAVLTVVALNATGYQWQVNMGSGYVNVVDGPGYSGANTATLSVANVSLNVTGYTYRVIVYGDCTSVTSGDVYIEVLSPYITQNPAASTICAGANTSFTGAAGLASAYQWQVDNGSGYANVTNGGVYSGATTTSLNITGATAAMNGYRYRLVATGLCAPAAVSSGALLTVNSAPAITQNPSAAAACIGGNASFSVAASGAGQTYQWQVNTGSGFTNISNGGVYSGATTSTLTITGATAGMNGYAYRVIVSGSCSPAATSSAATLTINAAPAITQNPSASTICSGGNTSFTVAATGVGLTYQWQVNNGSGFTNISNGGVYSGATTSTLTITGATGMNGYTYRAIVSGTCAPAATSSAAALTINAAPSISQNPSASSICDGAGTSFSVAANGTGLSYQWQVDSGSGFTNISNNSTYSGAATATLTISGAMTAMSGYAYRAVVSGTCAPAATSSPGTLTVQPNVTYYQDLDGDGFGNSAVTSANCSGVAPTGYVATSGDADDNNPNAYPGAPELCYDGVDNDQDGETDEGCIPQSQISASSCGASINYVDSYVIEAVPAAGADLYEFRITNGSFVSTATNTVPQITLAAFPGYQYGQTYTIDVRVQIGNDYSPFGASCQISTVAAPVSAIQASQCGTILPSISTPIFANSVDGATKYRFRVTNGANVQTIDKTIRYFALNQLATYGYGITYTVEVAAEVNGSFGAYGPACTVALAALKTKVQASQCGGMVANMGTLIYANNVSGATQYRFRVTNGASVQTIDRPVRSFSLNQLGTYAYGTTYSIDVAVETNGSFGDYGVICTVASPAAPITQVESSQCGATLATLATPINADAVADATQYRFRVANGSNVQTIVKPNRSFSLTELGSYATSTTYSIDVAVMAAGSWGAYGPACNVTSPDTLSKVRASQCGVTLVSIGTTIYADVVTGATQYRFRVTNGANVQIIDRPTNSFVLTQLPNYGYGITYNIDVAVERNGAFSIYGQPCNVSTPVLVTKIQPSQCGITLTNIGTLIYANNVDGATTYRFRVTSGANSQIIDRPTRSFSINQLPTFAAATTYSIDVSIEMNGTFGAYGVACSVTTPSAPLTQVEAAQCGTTLPTIATPINADAVASASQYRFRVTNGANVQLIEVPNRSFTLTQLSSYLYSTDYSVEVAVFTSGGWGSYGPLCHIMTPSAPTQNTQVRASQCGGTLQSISTPILAENIVGATQYRFRVVNGSNVQIIDRPSNSFTMTQLASYAYGTTYSVDVAVELNGAYGLYGPVCTVTTPKLTTKIRTAQCGTTLATMNTLISANTVSGATQYRFRVTNGSNVQILDRPTNSFTMTQLASYAANTTYSIDVAVETNGTFGPYGPACDITTPGSGARGAEDEVVEMKAGANAVQFDAVTLPNPFVDEFGLSVSTESDEMIKVTVYDMAGKSIAAYTVSPQETSNLKIGADFASGIYQVHVVQGTEVKTMKVIKK